MGDKLVTIAQFSNHIEAELARQLLADFGIKSVVTGQHATNIYAGLTAVAATELQVFESQAQKATDILQSTKEQQQEQ